jgi:hypothetical protein
MRTRTARVIAVSGVLAAGVLLAICREKPAGPQRSAGPPRILRLDELTEAEKRYGHAPTPSPGVTYQPDVVMLPAGADAIRSVSADGLVWTIDPDSKGADAIRPGKVLLLTSRAAGRVLGVRKTSDGLSVVLGPVEITEVVRDGRFSFDQAVDLDQVLSFTAPEVFDPAVPVTPIVASSFSRPLVPPASAYPCAPPAQGGGTVFLAASHERCDFYGPFINPVALAQATVHRFKLIPLVGSRGIGVRIASDAGGVQFLGEAVLYLNAPHLYFDLDIRGGRIVVCEVQLSGAAGLMMTFESASPSPMAANINERRYAPVEFSIPVTGLGVPFAVTVRQIFELKTAFTSTGSLKARAHYALKGGMRVGYRNGGWGMGGPTGVTPTVSLDNLLYSTKGVAFGVTGMVMTHQAKVMVGIGAFGFLTGPYGYLNSSVAVTRGSSIGILQGPLTCKQATLSMYVGAGVGYLIPEPVTGAINSILRALNIREEIQSSGGLETRPANIVEIGRYHPSLKACGN